MEAITISVLLQNNEINQIIFILHTDIYLFKITSSLFKSRRKTCDTSLSLKRKASMVVSFFIQKSIYHKPISFRNGFKKI